MPEEVELHRNSEIARSPCSALHFLALGSSSAASTSTCETLATQPFKFTYLRFDALSVQLRLWGAIGVSSIMWTDGLIGGGTHASGQRCLA